MAKKETTTTEKAALKATEKELLNVTKEMPAIEKTVEMKMPALKKEIIEPPTEEIIKEPTIIQEAMPSLKAEPAPFTAKGAQKNVTITNDHKEDSIESNHAGHVQMKPRNLLVEAKRVQSFQSKTCAARS